MTYLNPQEGGVPGGVDDDLQFNDGGAFGGFGQWDGTKFRLDTTEKFNINAQVADDISLVADTGAVQIGNHLGNHIAFDRNTIQQKINGTTAGTLMIQDLGGDVNFGNAIALTGFFVNSPLVTLGSWNLLTSQNPGAPEDNYVLTYDFGSDRIQLEAAAGGVGGSNSQIQYNNSGLLDGASPFTYDDTAAASGGQAIQINSLTTTADGLRIFGDQQTTGRTLEVTANNAAKTGEVGYFQQDNASSTALALHVVQDGSAYAIRGAGQATSGFTGGIQAQIDPSGGATSGVALAARVAGQATNATDIAVEVSDNFDNLYLMNDFAIQYLDGGTESFSITKPGHARFGGNIATTYTLSVQNPAGTETYIEILNNGGTNQGAFFGMETANDFALYNWQGGPMLFYTDTTASSGQIRMTIRPDGDVEINSGTLEILSNNPQLRFNDGNSTVNNRSWELQANADEFSLQVFDDGFTVGATVWSVARTANNIDELNIFATDMIDLPNAAGIYFADRADHFNTPAAGRGELWMRTSDDTLVFTDPSGTDHDLTAGGSAPAEAEGTNTVTITAGGGGTITVDTANDTVAWYRVGDLIHVCGRIEIDSVSSPSGSLQFNGMLPYFNQSETEAGGEVWAPVLISNYTGSMDDAPEGAATTNAVAWMTMRISEGSSVVQIRDGIDAGTTNSPAANVIATTAFYFNFTYKTDAAI